MTRAAAALFFLCLLVTGPGHAAERWAVTQGSGLSKTYTMPLGYALNRIFYLPGKDLFMLGLKTPQNAQHYYRLKGGEATGDWAAAPPDQTQFLSLPPYGTTIAVNSRLLRATTPQNFDQPFGAYRATALVSENRYTKKAARSGRYGATTYQETLGRGRLIFKIIDENNDALFQVEEDYAANSGDYVFWWTPDGRYAVMIPPKPSLEASPVILIAGPFPVEYAERVAEVNLRNDDAEKEVQEDNRLTGGEITAEQRYGFPYELAVDRLSSCRDFLNNFGRPDKITLNNPLHALYFGDEPAIVGMRFRLGFVAGWRSGEVEISAPLMRTASGYKSSLEDYFTIVTIQTDKEKTDVFCPR